MAFAALGHMFSALGIIAALGLAGAICLILRDYLETHGECRNALADADKVDKSYVPYSSNWTSTTSLRLPVVVENATVAELEAIRNYLVESELDDVTDSVTSLDNVDNVFSPDMPIVRTVKAKRKAPVKAKKSKRVRKAKVVVSAEAPKKRGRPRKLPKE